MKISAGEIIAALDKDEELQKAPEVLLVVKKYAVMLPQVFGDKVLAETVTLEGIMRHGAVFLRHAVDAGFGRDMDELTGADVSDLLELLLDQLENGETYELIAQMPLKAVMKTVKDQLNPGLFKKFKAGTLIVGDIVRHQPRAFFPSSGE